MEDGSPKNKIGSVPLCWGMWHDSWNNLQCSATRFPSRCTTFWGWTRTGWQWRWSPWWRWETSPGGWVNDVPSPHDESLWTKAKWKVLKNAFPRLCEFAISYKTSEETFSRDSVITRWSESDYRVPWKRLFWGCLADGELTQPWKGIFPDLSLGLGPQTFLARRRYIIYLAFGEWLGGGVRTIALKILKSELACPGLAFQCSLLFFCGSIS